MSIYESPAKYAAYTKMSIEDATRRCEHFQKIRDELHELSKCPLCENHTLEYEGGEWEAGISSYIYCDNEETDCEFTTDSNFRDLESHMHSDFDVVLMFASVLENEGLEATEQQIGLTWNEFLAKETTDLIVSTS